MEDSSIFIVGAKGQLGLALQKQYPGAQSADIDRLGITDAASVSAFDWSPIRVILNAAAYTNVDGAESLEGRAAAWNVNAVAVGNLARVALEHDITLVHVSTDYVFDGTKSPHTEAELYSPLSVYGETKAAGDIVIGMLPKHYILRTSWVIGDGKNFVRTMIELGQKGTNPSVVADQVGRLTFTTELVSAIAHLLAHRVPYGTYNVSNEGEPASWAAITRKIFADAGYQNTVTDVTTEKYYKGKEGIAPRPLQSTLDLSKLHATGFTSKDWETQLSEYIKKELAV